MTSIDDSSIDVAIDKGTLDAMISGSLWDPPDVVKTNTGLYIDEVCTLALSFLINLWLTIV